MKIIDPYNELFKWGPIDGKPLYVDPFFNQFQGYENFFGVSWPSLFGYIEKDKILIVVDKKELYDQGEKLFKEIVMDDEMLKKEYQDWIEVVGEMKKVEPIINKEISKLSDQELAELFTKFNKIHLFFWDKGFLPELSNWGGEQLLKRELLDFDKENFVEIFEALSAPEDYSFFQKEELELLHYKFIENNTELERKLKEHQKKYYWLRNSYGHTEILGVDHFRNELSQVSKEDAEKKIVEIKSYVRKTLERKRSMIDKYNIPDKIVKIAKNLSYCIWWQDYRKMFIFIANHLNAVFAEEVSKRKSIPFDDLLNYTILEFERLLISNTKLDVSARDEGFIIIYQKNGMVSYLEGNAARKYAEPYIDVKVDEDTEEFEGIVVSKGKKNIVKGEARVIFTPKNAEFDQGNVLIAPMTSPDFITVMRKASAIITDEGGMTCHAAIVSRELGIPCIVGTKIATKLIKDGDIVELNADKGIVRKIK